MLYKQNKLTKKQQKFGSLKYSPYFYIQKPKT